MKNIASVQFPVRKNNCIVQNIRFFADHQKLTGNTLIHREKRLLASNHEVQI